MLESTDTKRELARKARGLLERAHVSSGNRHASYLFKDLMAIGRVALIGGAIRELKYRPIHHFSSDLDFVVEENHENSLKKVALNYRAKPNRFGGYRVSFDNIDIDFWSAKQSWANVEKIKRVDCLEDVVNTTFFNVDAIMYIVEEDRIVAKPGTLEALRDRYLDINLVENPNPLGATVRALRRMHEHRMKASGRLLDYIAEQIDRNGWKAIIKLDEYAYPDKPIIYKVSDLFWKSGAEFSESIRKNNGKLYQNNYDLGHYY